MKHLLFLLDYYPPHQWGIENVFENILFRLLKQGYQVFLVTSRFDSQLAKEEHHWNLHLYRVGKGRKSFFFQSFWKGGKILQQHPEITSIHSSTYTSALPASILGWIFHKKRILTVHEIFGKLWKSFKPRYSRWVYQLFEWLSFVFPHEVYHCVSLYTLNSIRLIYGIPDFKLHLIYNGVDSDFRDSEKVNPSTQKKRRTKFWWEDKFLMLYYGHSWKSKGIDYLVAAIPELTKQHPDSVLIFNLIPSKRDKEMKDKILWAARFCPRGSVQLFDGFPQEELRELIATVDLIIAPSLAEGFGSVHSEACVMQKTLITTQVAAIPEVVSGNVVFVQAGSSEALIQGIKEAREKKLLSIPKKDFNRDTTVQELAKLYW